MKRGGWKHSQKTRDKIAATMRERRDEIAEATKARMADPAVRQRIREGMLKASASADELRTLRVVWRATPPTVRARFLAELLEPVCRADREGDQS